MYGSTPPPRGLASQTPKIFCINGLDECVGRRLQCTRYLLYEKSMILFKNLTANWPTDGNETWWQNGDNDDNVDDVDDKEEEEEVEEHGDDDDDDDDVDGGVGASSDDDDDDDFVMLMFMVTMTMIMIG